MVFVVIVGAILVWSILFAIKSGCASLFQNSAKSDSTVHTSSITIYRHTSPTYPSAAQVSEVFLSFRFSLSCARKHLVILIYCTVRVVSPQRLFLFSG
ncbi:hypothetical protein F5050DRAFT_947953 [Lentinula boryana]|uniref:Secreted protein n=1 Tax=Lentinula boryana TaxID=40481 RepID=A0ABQ8QLT7_9AGAR|nr:hypothetical protein F5050DRAFT_947953 [Lentinula boryana]